MGEYWKPVNVTRREYINPHDLDNGLKIREWNWPESRTMKLIAERWSDTDVVVFVSDYESLIVWRGKLEGEPPTYHSLNEDGYTRVRP